MEKTFMTAQEAFIKKDADTMREMLAPYKHAHFLVSHGNLGDQLIFAGTRNLLGKLEKAHTPPYLGTKYSEHLLQEAPGGELALISGGGAWCRTWEGFMAEHLPLIEAKYDKVIVLPSSFQMTDKIDATIRASNKTTFIARELVSYNLIRHYHQGTALMHDMAFHYDFTPYRKWNGNGNGAGDRVLVSYRKDDERDKSIVWPANNEDTSHMKGTVEDWLRHLAEYDTIKTDRAHVMIAGAMLGKMVLYRPSNYHKVPAIADFSLKGLPVYLSH